MKKTFFTSLFAFLSCWISAQTITTGDAFQDSALAVAIRTIDRNTEDRLLKAGADYGGEWTRDISMNSWNAVSLLRPEIAEYSLWSVTNSHTSIGHQYWDKIIWTIAAWNHFLITGDEAFLKEAYECCQRTMRELEDSCFDRKYGLFMGPAVFQDGIAAYEEPIYDVRWDTIYSGVVNYPNSRTIKCLSTNAVYYESYVCLAEMAGILQPKMAKVYLKKAETLKRNFRKHLYNSEEAKLYYLIDHTGKKHEFQEALGIAYAIMFGLVSESEARDILSKVYVSPFGIPAVWPHFQRYNDEMPGRHNVMVWPQVNMYFASACAQVGDYEKCYFEMDNLTRLATQHDSDGEVNFHEIYTTQGVPSGGWQGSWQWPPLNHQTWCATGYLRNYLYVVAGMDFQVDGLHFRPIGIPSGEVVLKDIHYRNATLNIVVRGCGTQLASCTINGKRSVPFVPSDAQGLYEIVLEVK